MKDKFVGIVTPLLLVVFALVLSLLPMVGGQSAEAAPPAAPTPIANVLESERGQFIRLYPQTAITADTNTTGVDIHEFSQIGVQYIIDETTVNTITIKAQYSNDNSNWFDGATLASAKTADTNDGVFIIGGWRYARFNLDVTNSNAVTVTLLGLAK